MPPTPRNDIAFLFRVTTFEDIGTNNGFVSDTRNHGNFRRKAINYFKWHDGRVTLVDTQQSSGLASIVQANPAGYETASVVKGKGGSLSAARGDVTERNGTNGNPWSPIGFDNGAESAGRAAVKIQYGIVEDDDLMVGLLSHWARLIPDSMKLDQNAQGAYSDGRPLLGPLAVILGLCALPRPDTNPQALGTTFRILPNSGGRSWYHGIAPACRKGSVVTVWPLAVSAGSPRSTPSDLDRLCRGQNPAGPIFDT